MRLQLPVKREQDVVRFDISVDDASAMDILQNFDLLHSVVRRAATTHTLTIAFPNV